jgi:hypothetical protein
MAFIALSVGTFKRAEKIFSGGLDKRRPISY